MNPLIHSEVHAVFPAARPGEVLVFDMVQGVVSEKLVFFGVPYIRERVIIQISHHEVIGEAAWHHSAVREHS